MWPEDPHGDTEWYGEGNTTWRGANASGRASGSKGRGRGRGAKAWEHENYFDVVLEETMTMTVWPNFPTANMAYRKIPR